MTSSAMQLLISPHCIEQPSKKHRTMINDMTCETDLMAAVEKADVSAILHCLAGGANVNAGSENGWTPLMLAILRGSPAIVKLLLEYGADPNLTTQSYENPSRSALTVAISNDVSKLYKCWLPTAQILIRGGWMG